MSRENANGSPAQEVFYDSPGDKITSLLDSDKKKEEYDLICQGLVE